MTLKQYSDLQRILGRLEGFFPAVPNSIAFHYRKSINDLTKTIDIIWREEHDHERV